MSEQLTPQGHNFDKIISIIEDTRSRALRAVNAELIRMYWDVGEYLSDLCANATFGDKVIDEVASYIAQSGVKVKGFNRRGLYRMKQFYETYRDDEFVTPLVTQISWTSHLQIMSSAKSKDERHFYLQLCAKEHYSNCSFVNSYRFIALFLHEPTFCAIFIFQTRPSCKQFCDTKIISSPCIVVC